MTHPDPTKPKRKRRPAKLRMDAVDGLVELGDAAHAGIPTRRVAPRIRIERTGESWKFVCPYVEEDGTRWEAMLFEAFGTRSISVMEHFLDTISALVQNDKWDEHNRVWLPLERDFQAAVNIINALQPQDEAQAAYAAQLVALHLSSMKLGAQAAKTYADPRTAAILAQTVRAFGDGLHRMATLQGKVQPKQVNQTIQVVYVGNRDERSVRFTGGVPLNGGQPQGTAGGAAVSLAALPSPCEDYRNGVPVPRSKRQARLPFSRWSSRLWRALRGA